MSNSPCPGTEPNPKSKLAEQTILLPRRRVRAYRTPLNFPSALRYVPTLRVRPSLESRACSSVYRGCFFSLYTCAPSTLFAGTFPPLSPNHLFLHIYARALCNTNTWWLVPQNKYEFYVIFTPIFNNFDRVLGQCFPNFLFCRPKT